ncbi:MAG: hypothetical protein KGZ65_15315 [Sphingomonadales bacterium]|nr:hypothetical protein [Sphingomonadaceae bacterium]MBS3932592.1 hypothetical protein [Sphingomonadales bacterium]
MRRSLVLTDEQARHPFLASLPPHIRTGAAAVPVPRARPSWFGDLRDFAVAYCACFIAVSIYIA